MRRMALFILIAAVAYFSYPFMQPAMSLANDSEQLEPAPAARKAEFIRLVEASSRMRGEAAAVSFDLPDPKPEAVFTVSR